MSELPRGQSPFARHNQWTPLGLGGPPVEDNTSFRIEMDRAHWDERYAPPCPPGSPPFIVVEGNGAMNGAERALTEAVEPATRTTALSSRSHCSHSNATAHACVMLP